jgi:diguanylate cyclase (GGDEF)-like protein
MMLDIDKFKSINDTYGHDVGDLVIKAIAAICKTTKRQTDVLGRIGGEEFAMLLPETDEAAAEVAAERLRKTVQDCTRVLPDKDIKVTVSIGIAGATLGMAAFEVLLKRADEALYEAKRSGRNRVVRATRTLSEVRFQHAAE